MTTEPKTAAQADSQLIADLARRAEMLTGTPKIANFLDAGPFLVLRNAAGDEQVHYLRETASPPARKTGSPAFTDQKSFVTYCDLHGLATPIYATMKPSVFTAILNDHNFGSPGHRDFRATLTLEHSDEWNVWTKHNGVGAPFNSNESFAIFLEDNAIDIVRPDPTEFLQLALSFKVNEDVSFSSQQRLQDGHVQFAFNKIVNASGTGAAGHISIPETFKIAIPVFKGMEQATYEIEARFRFRLRENKLTIWYELVRPHKVLEAAFRAVWEEVKAGTEQEILLGTP